MKFFSHTADIWGLGRGGMGLLPYVEGYRAGYKAAAAADGPGGKGYNAAVRLPLRSKDSKQASAWHACKHATIFRLAFLLPFSIPCTLVQLVPVHFLPLLDYPILVSPGTKP